MQMHHTSNPLQHLSIQMSKDRSMWNVKFQISQIGLRRRILFGVMLVEHYLVLIILRTSVINFKPSSFLK